MRNHNEAPMGRIAIEIELANNEDLVAAKLGVITAAKVRRAKIQGIVDPGAAELMLPKKVVDELGLPLKESKITVQYADGRLGSRPLAHQVSLSLLGRDGVFKAVVEPKRDTALIGAIVLEDLDLLVDCKRQRVMPRDPKAPLYEIE
jgi:predicted aspartyl protease